jgi:hypothetical protein
MLDAQVQERAFELVASVDRGGVVGWRRRIDRHVRHLGPASS